MLTILLKKDNFPAVLFGVLYIKVVLTLNLSLRMKPLRRVRQMKAIDE